MKNFIKASLLAAMVAAPAMADEAFGGVGITIYQIRDGVKVAEVIPGTPAAESKLLPGDVIISVDGVSLKGQNIEFSKGKLRGQVNKPLEVTFVSNGDTLSTVIRRTQLTVTDLEGKKVEAWYGDKTEFNAQELETYASANSDKQLVAVLKHGYRVAEGTVNAAGLNGIYVEKAEEFAPKASGPVAKANSATLKGFGRSAISFELKNAGAAVVTVMSAEGEAVASIRVDDAQAGFNTVSWNSDNVPSGRYMVTIEQNGSVSGGKNVILK